MEGKLERAWRPGIISALSSMQRRNAARGCHALLAFTISATLRLICKWGNEVYKRLSNLFQGGYPVHNCGSGFEHKQFEKKKKKNQGSWCLHFFTPIPFPLVSSLGSENQPFPRCKALGAAPGWSPRPSTKSLVVSLSQHHLPALRWYH